MSETADKIKQLPIVRDILKVLKMDDEGKITTGFDKYVTSCESRIVSATHNLKATELTYKGKLEANNEKLLNAKEALFELRTTATKEDFKNNIVSTKFLKDLFVKVHAAKADIDTVMVEREQIQLDQESDITVDKAVIDKIQYEIDFIQNELDID